MKVAAKEVFFIMGMVVVWATYFAISKWAVIFCGSPFAAGLLLRMAAFVFLTVFLIVKKQFGGLFRIGKPAFILLLIGVLGYLVDAFANIGFQKSSVSTGTALLKTDILMANLATAIIMKEKLRLGDWIGTILMLVGVIFVLNIDFRKLSLNWYDIFFILSALSVTINAFVVKSAQKKYQIESSHIAYYNNFVVVLLFFISALISDSLPFSLIKTFRWETFTLIAIGGLAQTFIYIFYYRNLKKYPVWKVKLFLLLVPVISCFIGVFVFEEALVALQLVGIALVLLGGGVILLRNKFMKTKCE